MPYGYHRFFINILKSVQSFYGLFPMLHIKLFQTHYRIHSTPS